MNMSKSSANTDTVTTKVTTKIPMARKARPNQELLELSSVISAPHSGECIVISHCTAANNNSATVSPSVVQPPM